MRNALAVLTLGLPFALVLGCGCETPPAGGGDSGGIDAAIDAAVDAPRADAGMCTGAGVACAADGDCCSGLRCLDSGGGTTVCTAACGGAGASCTIASDCCDLGCASGTCSTTAACATIGATCTGDGDCCSFHCNGGT